jgi:hypothetical protein
MRRVQHLPVEAIGASAPVFLPVSGHGLMRAVHMAYALHYPFVLTPDAVWLAIAQGFAIHVNAHADRLRGKFVRHDGRATITIRRDDFIKGSPDNPWPETFAAFSDAVAAHVGRQRDLVVCDFTTTGPCERAASQVVLLDALQSYFDYVFVTRCGIPEITLDGTVDDWRAVRRRSRALEEYDLAWWTDALGPVLDQLVATAEGRVDVAFWRTFFKHEDGSGGPWACGWINVLFPYLRRLGAKPLVRNDHMSAWQQGFEKGRGGGATPMEIPSGLSSVPFQWRYLNEVFSMEFLGGFVGVAQDEGSLGLRPAIGWAVRDALRSPETAEEFFERQENGPGLTAEATLVAGRATDIVSLTADEAAKVCALVQRFGEASGVRLVCVPAGDFAITRQFQEIRVPIRFVVGLRVAPRRPGGTRQYDIAPLSDGVDGARSLSEATWRELSAILPSELRGAPALYLAASAPREGMSATLRFGEADAMISVAEVDTAGTAATQVDVSLAAHGARIGEVRERGGAPGSAVYVLNVGRSLRANA